MSQYHSKVCGHRRCHWSNRSFIVLPETPSDVSIIFRHTTKIAESDN